MHRREHSSHRVFNRRCPVSRFDDHGRDPDAEHTDDDHHDGHDNHIGSHGCEHSSHTLGSAALSLAREALAFHRPA
jgi:hypothetical protein